MMAKDDRNPMTAERHGSSLRIVLGRSSHEKVDSLVCRTVAEALKSLPRDPGIRCAILGRSFAFGPGREPAGSSAAELAAAITLLRTLPLPTVGVLDGEASGIGAGLLLGCDLRLATPESSLVLSPADEISALEVGVAWELAHTLGRARAFDVLYAGRPLSASEGLELGLLSRIVPRPELDGFVDRLAADLEARSRNALAAVKRALGRAEEADFDEALEFEVLLVESVTAD
jgi:enoyl-CoA hydratase/carnithine racemase